MPAAPRGCPTAWRAPAYALSQPRSPWARSRPQPWSVLTEVSSPRGAGLAGVLGCVLGAGAGRGLVADATIASSLDQAESFWRVRETLAEAQKHEGGSIKHDVSVPVAAG